MTYHVEKAVVEATTRCRRDHGCLLTENGRLCRVLASVEEKSRQLFVQCLHEAPCPYQEMRDGRRTCQCPVRIRIYQRYGK